MKAVLDHVGIAVSDLQASLAFFKDVLGPARRGQRGDRVAARPRDLPQHRHSRRSNARGDRRRIRRSRSSREARRPACIMWRCASTISRRRSRTCASRGIRLIDEQPRPGRRRRAGCVHSSVGVARRAGRAEAAGAEGRDVHDGRPAYARRLRADHAVRRLHRPRRRRDVRRRARRRCGRSGCRRTIRTAFRSACGR